jgi:CheY-like chemotaxis protein
VVDDVEEVRDGITLLLESDGYLIEAARSEKYAIECALRTPPQLILVNLAGSSEDVIEAAQAHQPARGKLIQHVARQHQRPAAVLAAFAELVDGALNEPFLSQ